MEELSVHEAAEIFPLMAEDDLRKLAQDIKDNGLLEPICLYEGQILDGRNRYQACLLVGVEPKIATCSLNGIGPVEFVVSKNLHRRHLSTAQRAALAVEILPYLAEQAAARRSAGTKEARTPEMGDIGEAAEQAAELVGLGTSTVERTALIAKKNPEILERMKKGEFKSVNHARRAAGVIHRGDTINPDDRPVIYYGKGDMWREATQPLIRYLRSWDKRGFEFRHLNPAEASRRLKEIATIKEGLEAASQDLMQRSKKATTRVSK